jgi:DNA-binding NarL/FixJ family response regulator
LTYKVAIVDDHLVVAEGIARLIQSDASFEISGLYGTAEGFLSSLRSVGVPDLVVLDLWLPSKPGSEVIRFLKIDYPKIKILVVSAAARGEVVARCMSEGASGFLGKSQTGDQLLVAMNAIMRGERFIDPALFNDAIEHLASPDPASSKMDGLSDREYTVMICLARGESIKSIADTLNLNAKTVSTYRNRLLKKLGVASNADLTAMCIKRGLLEFEDQL